MLLNQIKLSQKPPWKCTRGLPSASSLCSVASDFFLQASPQKRSLPPSSALWVNIEPGITSSIARTPAETRTKPASSVPCSPPWILLIAFRSTRIESNQFHSHWGPKQSIHEHSLVNKLLLHLNRCIAPTILAITRSQTPFLGPSFTGGTSSMGAKTSTNTTHVYISSTGSRIWSSKLTHSPLFS